MTRSQASRQRRQAARLADLERELAAARLSAATSVAVASGATRSKKSKNRPRRRGAGRGRGQVGSVVERRASGNDIIGSVTMQTASAHSGAGILHAPINPRNFPGTRFYQESKLWTRWRPVSLKVRLVSGASQLVVGRCGLGWHADPKVDFPTGQSGVVRFGTLRPGKSGHPSDLSEISIPSGMRNSSQTWYIIEGEPEDSDHGTLIALVLSSLGAMTGTSAITFQVELDWTVEFSGPDVESAEGTAETIYADSGYENYFTTSVSDWAAGQKLTLKHSSGGYAALFSDARPGIVYELDPKAVLKAYTSATAQANVKYGVRIPNYYEAALAVFVDLKKAQDFASSGDSTHCMTYHSAGGYVSPSNPAWTEVTSSASGFALRLNHRDRTRSAPRPVAPALAGDWVVAEA